MTQKFTVPILGLLLILGATINFSWFAATDNFLQDAFFRLRGPGDMPENVVFVYLDEQDIQSLGGWPLTRDYWTYALHNATQAGAKAVAIDVLFSTENPVFQEFDRSLVEVAESSHNLILPLVANLAPNTGEVILGEVVQPFKSLRAVTAATGFANLGNDPIIREVPVLLKDDSTQYFSFGVELARALAGMSDDEIQKLLPPSSRLKINFAGYDFSAKGISFVQFLQTLRANPDALKLDGKLVLIAPVAPGLPIVRKTPFADAVPAALIHLNVAENILQQNFLRSSPRLAIIAIMLAFIVAAQMLVSSGWRKWWYIWLPALPVIYLSIAFALFVLTFRVIPVSYPLFSFFLVCFTAFLLREKHIHRKLVDREGILHAEIQQVRRKMAAAESALFELRQKQAIEQEKSLAQSRENEKKLLVQQKRWIELEKQLRDLQEFDDLPTASPAPTIANIIHAEDSPLASVVDLVQKVAADEIPVLIEGETGTGKEIIARAIHEFSNRKKRPFIAVNCGALPESILESELFGHERGAFTGAQSLRRGRFELADGGTIFLDEISETSHAFQARLLRVLQEGLIERLGSEQTLKIDVRCIAASNQNIKQCVDDGRFRADVFYRLNGFPLQLPPLRQRPMDIPLLTQYFLDKHGFSQLKVSKAVFEKLSRYSWPGNVRELENTVRRMALLAKSDGKKIIQMALLPEEILQGSRAAVAGPEFNSLEEQILAALRQFQFSRSAISDTARLLGNKDRGTITEYFRGLCFQYLQDNNFDITAAAAALAATSDDEIMNRLVKKIQAYLANLDPNEKKSDHPQYKGLPKKFHPALDAVLDFLTAQMNE